jgi:predicted transcriptional regulator
MARESIRRDKLSITLDDDLLNALEDAAGRERLPVAAIARRAVAQWADSWRSQHRAGASI